MHVLQTARGASLTTEPSDQPEPRHAVLAFAVAAVALALDLVTKALAVAHLQGRAPVHLVGSLLQLELTRNPGAAFSTGTSHTPLIATVALVAAGVVTWFVLRVRSTGWAWALGLLLAGVLGNLVDRAFREPSFFHGHVVDFLALPHWPVFNLADVCINIAAVLIVIQAVRGIRIDGSREVQRGSRART